MTSSKTQYITDILNEDGTRNTVINILADFFQDEYSNNPTEIGDWLEQGGTTPDLFMELVAAIRMETAQPTTLAISPHEEKPHG